MKTPINIAILASGAGTNADRICTYFSGREDVIISLILTNNPQAGVLAVADRHHVRSVILTNDVLKERLLKTLELNDINFVVLAGFLRPIPENTVKRYADQMVNIHPALLPKFGGKGMYGIHVHRAVIESGEQESGISIHLVNENYDEGEIVFQARCPVDKTDTPDSLAQKVHQLEHLHFPPVIDQLLHNQAVSS